MHNKNKKSGQLTIANRCALIFKDTQGYWLIQSKTYIPDFLLVINCHLCSNSHCFRDIASRTRSKTTPPQFEPPDQWDSLRISESNLADEEPRHWATFYWKLNDPSFSRLVTIHVRHRQMTYYDNSRTLHCKGRLETTFMQPVIPMANAMANIIPSHSYRLYVQWCLTWYNGSTQA